MFPLFSSLPRRRTSQDRDLDPSLSRLSRPDSRPICPTWKASGLKRDITGSSLAADTNRKSGSYLIRGEVYSPVDSNWARNHRALLFSVRALKKTLTNSRFLAYYCRPSHPSPLSFLPRVLLPLRRLSPALSSRTNLLFLPFLATSFSDRHFRRIGRLRTRRAQRIFLYLASVFALFGSSADDRRKRDRRLEEDDDLRGTDRPDTITHEYRLRR